MAAGRLNRRVRHGRRLPLRRRGVAAGRRGAAEARSPAGGSAGGRRALPAPRRGRVGSRLLRAARLLPLIVEKVVRRHRPTLSPRADAAASRAGLQESRRLPANTWPRGADRTSTRNPATMTGTTVAGRYLLTGRARPRRVRHRLQRPRSPGGRRGRRQGLQPGRGVRAPRRPARPAPRASSTIRTSTRCWASRSDDEHAYLISRAGGGRSRFDRSGLDDEEAVRAIAAVCDALAHAHERQVVHRDVKPSNILVSDDGERRADRLRHRPRPRRGRPDDGREACWAPSPTWRPSRPGASRPPAPPTSGRRR